MARGYLPPPLAQGSWARLASARSQVTVTHLSAGQSERRHSAVASVVVASMMIWWPWPMMSARMASADSPTLPLMTLRLSSACIGPNPSS